MLTVSLRSSPVEMPPRMPPKSWRSWLYSRLEDLEKTGHEGVALLSTSGYEAPLS